MRATTMALLHEVSPAELGAVEGGVNLTQIVGTKPWFDYQLKLEAAVQKYPWIVNGPPYPGTDPVPPCPVC